MPKNLARIAGACIALIFLSGSMVSSPSPAATVASNHDFDYQFGTWNVRVSRLLQSPGRSEKWVSYLGTHTVTPLWNGRANIGVLEIKGDAGCIEGLQLRLYNPQTRTWSLSFASSSEGELGTPSVGSFHNGVGVFRETERIDGKTILVRSESRTISTTSYRDVIARSADGGKTWSPVWIATYDKR